MRATCRNFSLLVPALLAFGCGRGDFNADRRAVKLAARIPLVFATRTYLLSPRATRFPVNATGPMPMFDAEVKG